METSMIIIVSHVQQVFEYISLPLSAKTKMRITKFKIGKKSQAFNRESFVPL